MLHPLSSLPTSYSVFAFSLCFCQVTDREPPCAGRPSAFPEPVFSLADPGLLTLISVCSQQPLSPIPVPVVPSSAVPGPPVSCLLSHEETPDSRCCSSHCQAAVAKETSSHTGLAGPGVPAGRLIRLRSPGRGWGAPGWGHVRQEERCCFLIHMKTLDKLGCSCQPSMSGSLTTSP